MPTDFRANDGTHRNDATLLGLHPLDIASRLQCTDARCAQRRRRAISENVEHARILQYTQRVSIHAYAMYGGMNSTGTAQLLFRDAADRRSLRATLEHRIHLSHHTTDVGRTLRDHLSDGRANLVVADVGRQIRLQRRHLGSLTVGEIGARRLVVHLDRLAPLLDALPEHLVHFRIRELALLLDAPILDV